MITGRARAFYEKLSESDLTRAHQATGPATDPETITEQWFAALVPLAGVKWACAITGRARATHYRHLCGG